MSIEVLKDFPYPEYADRYSVSNQGKIWSKRKKEYLKSKISKKVEVVQLNNLTGKGSSRFQVDKIIADTFLGKSNLFLEHIDGNILNNKANNLRWITTENYLSKKYKGIWKEVGKHPGYFVSDQGKVWSMKSKELLILQKIGDRLGITIGYPEKKFYLVNRLVAIEFLPNPNNLPFVTHKSGNQLDNNVNNLEWISQPKHNTISKSKKIIKENIVSDVSMEFCIILDWLPDYQIFDDGRVYSLKTKKFLTPSLNSNGYLRVSCIVNNICKKLSIHRLVAEAWIPNKNPEKNEVNHKNMDRTDNRSINLEWMSTSENNIHALENNPNRKKRFQKPIYCIDIDTEEIIAHYDGLMDASRDTEINSGSISKACKQGTTAGGYKWRYVNS